MKLDENTKISVGIAIAVIGGGSAWMTSIALQTTANAKALESIEIRQIEYTESIQNIEKDVGIIKTKLDLLLERRKTWK